jgi:hypothetical protein
LTLKVFIRNWSALATYFILSFGNRKSCGVHWSQGTESFITRIRNTSYPTFMPTSEFQFGVSCMLKFLPWCLFCRYKSVLLDARLMPKC